MSRFSGFGECIPRNCQKFKLVSPLDRSLLVENKKMTHDVFVECGFERLRPKQVCFPRVYTPDLAQQVLHRLGLGRESGCALVVLKLLNRCRGAGVVVVQADQLDATLRLLLSPPDDQPSNGCGALEAALGLDPESMQEQCLHWWSNECPLFAAERCASSQPVLQDGLEYDGTLRVGFVLLRTGEGDDETLAVEFLGGYWKLPKEPISSWDARARCVSKARSGTAPVLEEDLQDVCEELRAALPSVFESEGSGMVPSLMRRYAQEPLAFSFALARHAAAKVQQKAQEHARAAAKGAELAELAGAAPGEAGGGCGWASTPAGRQQQASLRLLFEMAEARIMEGSEDVAAFRDSLPLRDPAARAVASYIERQLGVLDAHLGNWDGAQARFRRAIELHRWNASAQYLLGVCQQRRSEHSSARESFARSILTDPDFKAPYACLGATALAQGDWACAAAVSAAGLRRHPQAFQCSYNLGLALAHKLQHGLGLAPSAAEPGGAEAEAAAPPAEAPAEVPAEAPAPPASTPWPQAADAEAAYVEGRQHRQCGLCGNPVLKTEDILSEAYWGASGPAYLVRAAYNVQPAGEPRKVAFVSGQYDVQDAACGRCGKGLGMRYTGAEEERNRQKVGCFLIAQGFTVKKAARKQPAAPAPKEPVADVAAAAAKPEAAPPRPDAGSGSRAAEAAEAAEAPPSAQMPPVAPAPLKAAPVAAPRPPTGAEVEARPLVAASSATAAAVELRRAKEQKEQTKTQWSDEDDELLGVLEQLAARLAVAPERVAAAAAAVAARRATAGTEGASASSGPVAAAAEGEEDLCSRLCAALAGRRAWTSRHFRG